MALLPRVLAAAAYSDMRYLECIAEFCRKLVDANAGGAVAAPRVDCSSYVGRSALGVGYDLVWFAKGGANRVCIDLARKTLCHGD